MPPTPIIGAANPEKWVKRVSGRYKAKCITAEKGILSYTGPKCTRSSLDRHQS
jgi:hypothetical protein